MYTDSNPPGHYEYIDNVCDSGVTNIAFYSELKGEGQQDQAGEGPTYEVLDDEAPAGTQSDVIYQVITDSICPTELNKNDARDQSEERLEAATDTNCNDANDSETRSGNTIEVVRNAAYYLEEQTSPSTRNDKNNFQGECDQRASLIEMQQNDAYIRDEPLTTSANESYNFAARFNSFDAEAEQSVVCTELVPLDRPQETM